MREEKMKEKFKELEKAGEVILEDYKEVVKVLGPEEKLKFLAAVPVKGGKGKNLILLTNTRLIFQRKGKFNLVGEHEGIEDFPYERITGINSEPRKKYDMVRIETKEGKKEEFMAPEDTGGKIAGLIRSLELEKKELEERKKETALKKIERLSDLKEKGAITKEEFEEKKKKLLEEV